MSIVAALFLALAVLAAQMLHGGLWHPALVLPAYLLLLLAGGASLFAMWRGRFFPAAGGLLLTGVVLAYFLWRAAHAADAHLARIELGQILAFGLAFIIAAAGVNDERARWVLLGTLGVAAALQAGYGFFQLAGRLPEPPFGWFLAPLQDIYEGRFVTRLRGSFINPNQLAWFLGWAALMALSVATWGRIPGILRVVLGYFGLVFVAADILTGSRGGVIALGLGGLVFLAVTVTGAFGMLRRGRWLVVVGALFAVLAVGGIGYVAYSSNWVARARVDDALRSENLRTALARVALRQAEVSPLVGEGPGSFVYAARLYRENGLSYDAVYAHNDWLQTLAEYGVIGLVGAVAAFLVLAGGGLVRFFETVRHRMEATGHVQSNQAAVGLGCITSVVAFAAHSALDFNMHVPANALLAGLTCGLLATTSREHMTRGSEFLRAMVIRCFAAVLLLGLAGGLIWYGWRYAPADHQSRFAMNALERGDALRALRHVDAGLAWNPDDPSLLALRGRSLFEAETQLSLMRNPPAAELTRSRREQRYTEAAAAYAAAIERQPLERSHYVGLSGAEATRRNFAVAQQRALEAIALDVGHSYPFAAYGDLLAGRGEKRRALRIFYVGGRYPDSVQCWSRELELREELPPVPAPATLP